MKCFFCKGELAPSTTTHVVTLDNCIIIVKNVPCTRCEQCGEAFFDDEVAKHLEQLVEGAKNNLTEIVVMSYSDNAA